jgi:16S rRNA processing protein RimM
MEDKAPGWLLLGRVSGIYGVRGWVRVFSYTHPRANILNYPEWYLRHGADWVPRRLLEGRTHGKGIIARLDGCDDRDQAASLVSRDIAIRREQLPEIGEDEFYWADLIGLRVETVDGVELGTVSRLMETGANDVLVVEGDRERLIPYLWQDVVKRVDVESAVMIVDWDPEF